jgi:DNA-directed RNA polymerase delta subunit
MASSNTAKSETDLACEVLTKNKEPMQYLDLIQAIGKKLKKKNYDNETINSIYTALNMDNRLEYQGDGYWFLTGSQIVKKKGKKE